MAHRGQRDKAGEPYILHPLRVMHAVCGFHERMAAVLHDVVEDTSVTLDELRRRGFPQAVVAAIDALSRRAGEPYLAFIDRAGSHRIARPVKLADLLDNLDPRRLARFSPAQQKRLLRKYTDALRRLAGGRRPLRA